MSGVTLHYENGTIRVKRGCPICPKCGEPPFDPGRVTRGPHLRHPTNEYAQSNPSMTDESDTEDLYKHRKAYINEISQRDDEIGVLSRAIKHVGTEE